MNITRRQHYLALIGINISGLNITDKQRIEEVGFTAWLNEVSQTPPTPTRKPKPQIERTCTVCNAPFTASRSDAEYCSPRCRQRASRYGQTVTVSQNRATENQRVTDAVAIN